jgi:hypothetical protein
MQRLVEARLDHEKNHAKAKKEAIKNRDNDLEASHTAVLRETETIERCVQTSWHDSTTPLIPRKT